MLDGQDGWWNINCYEQNLISADWSHFPLHSLPIIISDRSLKTLFVMLLNIVAHGRSQLWGDTSAIHLFTLWHKLIWQVNITVFPLNSPFFITGMMAYVRFPSGSARVCVYQRELYLLLRASFTLFQRSWLICNFKAVILTAAQGMWDFDVCVTSWLSNKHWCRHVRD